MSALNTDDLLGPLGPLITKKPEPSNNIKKDEKYEDKPIKNIITKVPSFEDCIKIMKDENERLKSENVRLKKEKEQHQKEKNTQEEKEKELKDILERYDSWTKKYGSDYSHHKESLLQYQHIEKMISSKIYNPKSYYLKMDIIKELLWYNNKYSIDDLAYLVKHL